MFLIATNLYAGDFYSSYSKPCGEEGSVSATIQLEDKKIYNFVIVIHFIKNSIDKKIYTDSFQNKFFEKVKSESKSIALNKILEIKTFQVSTINKLKFDIEAAISENITKKIKATYPNENLEIPFYITDMFLVDPKRG